MNSVSSSNRPGYPDDVAGVARLVRRVCLLREQGLAAAAVRLEENELAAAVRELQVKSAGQAMASAELQALFAREAERVADAAVLCELLLPQLLAQLPDATSARPSAISRLAVEPSVLIPRTPGPGSPAIPDLLDAMLAAERTNRRPLASLQRGA